MFTGLVQAMGTIEKISMSESSAKLTIRDPFISSQIKRGESVSVNGICLTVVDFDNSTFSVDVMKQTLALTSISSLTPGGVVNLELATAVSDRLGGHIVQGHVDGVGKVVALTPGDQWSQFQVGIPAHLMKYIVAQGSIAIEGVSLTVAEIDDALNQITVWLIPETLTKTNLSQKKNEELLNIEVDVLAKYIERLMERGKHHE